MALDLCSAPDRRYTTHTTWGTKSTASIVKHFILQTTYCYDTVVSLASPGQSLSYILPVDDVPDLVHILGTHVPVLHVIRMFPYVYS